jgi:hypothetical protein
MGRPKVPQTAAEALSAIERTKERYADDLKALEERQRMLTLQEDQRRGALIREMLARQDGPLSGELRRVLQGAIGAHEAYLFGLPLEDQRRQRGSGTATASVK